MSDKTKKPSTSTNNYSKREDWLKNKRRNFHNPVSSIVDGVLSGSLDSLNKYEASLLINWNSIFGEELSSKIHFDKLSFLSKKSPKANLFISIAKKDMLEISHLKSQIIDELTLYFGFKLVNDVKISTSAKLTKPKQNQEIQNKNEKIDNNTLKNLQKEISCIEDEELRESLLNLIN